MSRLPFVWPAGIMRPMKAATIILFLLCAGLAVALVMRHNKTVELEQAKTARELRIAELSNTINQTRKDLDEKELVARKLEEILASTKQELTGVSNKLINTSADLAKTQNEKQASEAASKAEIEKRDQQIAELTSKTNAYAIKMDELTVSIGSLGKQIAETERKLTAAEGDREFLLKELKRLQVEKTELEKQFNDLKLLRTQVAKLKEELSISKRLDWIRSGLYGSSSQKGAEKLLATAAAAPRTNYNLNVELKQDGTATITTTPGGATNKPAPPK
jgi:septal ring factor EnvC (AmiA/AmiB activator)